MKKQILITLLFLPTLWLVFKLFGYNPDMLSGFWVAFLNWLSYVLPPIGLVVLGDHIVRKRKKR